MFKPKIAAFTSHFLLYYRGELVNTIKHLYLNILDLSSLNFPVEIPRTSVRIQMLEKDSIFLL